MGSSSKELSRISHLDDLFLLVSHIRARRAAKEAKDAPAQPAPVSVD